MSRRARWEYLKMMYGRYRRALRQERSRLLTEMCQVCGCHRKHAIRLMRHFPREPMGSPRPRGRTYGVDVLNVLLEIWRAAGHPWSHRLKAALPLWLPWAKQRIRVSEETEGRLAGISPATIDRLLRPHKRRLQKRLYGTTRPGSLLKHHIPIQTHAWDVDHPGFLEVDLVSHSGSNADGHFLHSLNTVDIHTTWTEARAVLGKGQAGVVDAFRDIQKTVPFSLQGIDSDNGSEFINAHLKRFCDREKIQFTRGRPYKKDDNAHIEQKNWTHVRKLLGYARYDTESALTAINHLYRNEWRLYHNLFLPSVKLLKKNRIGSKLRRVYDAPQTPLDRVRQSSSSDPEKVRSLLLLQQTLDPFQLSKTIEKKINSIYAHAKLR